MLFIHTELISHKSPTLMRFTELFSSIRNKNRVGACVMAQSFCYIQSQGMYWLSYWLIHSKKGHIGSVSCKQPFVVGLKSTALWLQAGHKGTLVIVQNNVCSKERHSQRSTTALTRDVFGNKTVVGLLVWEADLVFNPSLMLQCSPF